MEIYGVFIVLLGYTFNFVSGLSMFALNTITEQSGFCFSEQAHKILLQIQCEQVAYNKLGYMQSLIFL